MYKVFYNQKPLFFTSDLNRNSDETPLFHIKFSTAESIIKALKSKRVTGVYLYHSDEVKLQKHFLKKFSCVEAAGGLVAHSNGSYLFIYRNDKWDLPKGKVEKREVIIDAAVREVMEETGVADLVVKKPMPTTYHLYNANGKYKLKKTYWFLMKTNSNAPLTPQLEENIQSAVWKTTSEFPSLKENAYENIKILLEEVD
ncbi:NUDIX domain-containing protein [Flavobacteriaceae bacterium]|nr:NUDIX domain-containing protein [Flavobacteriaceae bacterium]